MIRTVLGLLAFVAVASGLSFDAQSIGFRSKGLASSDVMIPFRIALSRQNSAVLPQKVLERSDPDSPSYGQYDDSLIAFTAPSEESWTAVSDFLASKGCSYNQEASSLMAVCRLDTISAMFHTTFYNVEHATTGQKAIVADELDMPEEIAEHVEAVFGLTGLPRPTPAKKPVSGITGKVTPAVIRAAYGVDANARGSGSLKVRQAVAEFQGQLLSQDDLTKFFTEYVPFAKSGDNQVYKYVGSHQSGEGVEAELDIQYIMGVAAGVKTEAWQYTPSDFCSDLKTWTQATIAETDRPIVFSVSYGWQGPLSQIGCDTSMVNSIDKDFQTLATAGVSIIFASGDSGSGYTSTFGADAKLYPSWPASSPWVTAVGSTRFMSGQTGQEQATDQFGSGGGFSRQFTAPTWQQDAIKTFMSEEKDTPPAKTYGVGGRGTPDVAALGEEFQVVVGGNTEGVGGTSAAAPTFAALVSMVNDELVSGGGKPMGYLNTFLYKNADAMTDITVGDNRISREGTKVPDGWDCEQGWDPVTGLGTVNYPKFLAAAKSAQA